MTFLILSEIHIFRLLHIRFPFQLHLGKRILDIRVPLFPIILQRQTKDWFLHQEVRRWGNTLHYLPLFLCYIRLSDPCTYSSFLFGHISCLEQTLSILLFCSSGVISQPSNPSPAPYQPTFWSLAFSLRCCFIPECHWHRARRRFWLLLRRWF